jgi:hypothetical protein
MPAFTPNRNYPYSIPADPTDVPGAIQDLAEAIDLDIAAIRAAFPLRPAAQISSTAPQVTGGLGLNTVLTFDRIDFDTGGVITSDLWRGGWLNPGSGVWLVVGRVAVPRSLPSPLPTALESHLRQTPFIQAPNSEIAQTTEHVFPAVSDQVYDLTVTMAGEIPSPPSEGFRLTFQALQSGGTVSAFTVGARTLTVFRMHT